MLGTNPFLLEVTEGTELCFAVPVGNGRWHRRSQEHGDRQKLEEVNDKKLLAAKIAFTCLLRPRNWHLGLILQLQVKKVGPADISYMKALPFKIMIVSLVTTSHFQ